MLGRQQRIGYIDGLRAIAVLFVVGNHAFSATSTIGQSFGVGLFFVISGFCLSFPTLERIGRSGAAGFDVYRYAAHRIVRIVPPYYACIAILAAGAILSVPGINRPGALDVVRQMLFLDNHTTFLTPSFWSLSLEFRWYFFFPLALILWVRAPRAFLALVLLLMIAGQTTMATSSDVIAMPAFLLGIVAAYLRVWGHRLAGLAAPACAAMIVIAYLKTGTLISPFWELGVFLLVVAAGAVGWLGRILSMRLLTAIGVASYSIYLVQEPVIRFVEWRHVPAAFAVAAAIVAGFAFWFLMERPLLSGALRERLVQEFANAFAKWGEYLGIQRNVELSRAAAMVPRRRAAEDATAGVRPAEAPFSKSGAAPNAG